MSKLPRAGLAAAVVLAVVLFLVLRGGDDERDEAAPTRETTAAAGTSGETGLRDGGGRDERSPARPRARELRVTVPAGGPTSLARFGVEQGEEVLLVGGVVAVAAVYLLAVEVARLLVGGRPDLAGSFAWSLVPIAFVYALAHYFSLFVTEGQRAWPLASDPFRVGLEPLRRRCFPTEPVPSDAERDLVRPGLDPGAPGTFSRSSSRTTGRSPSFRAPRGSGCERSTRSSP